MKAESSIYVKLNAPSSKVENSIYVKFPFSNIKQSFYWSEN